MGDRGIPPMLWWHVTGCALPLSPDIVIVWLHCWQWVGFFEIIFVSNNTVEAALQSRKKVHLGGKKFKNIVFLYINIYFCPKMGWITVFIYVFIILIFYWFLNHFCICYMCNFVCCKAVDSTVSELFLYVSKSFSRQNFHFGYTYGEFFGDGKGLFQSELDKASNQSSKY